MSGCSHDSAAINGTSQSGTAHESPFQILNGSVTVQPKQVERRERFTVTANFQVSESFTIARVTVEAVLKVSDTDESPYPIDLGTHDLQPAVGGFNFKKTFDGRSLGIPKLPRDESEPLESRSFNIKVFVDLNGTQTLIGQGELDITN